MTHTGQADAIPHHTILAGEVLERRVTPSDGINRGETVSTLCGELDSTCIRVTINVPSSSWVEIVREHHEERQREAARSEPVADS